MSIPYADAKKTGSSIVVPHCPHCGKAHEHAYAAGSGARQAPCGRGAYKIILSLGNASASPAVETKPETPWAKSRKRGARRA